MGALSNNLGTIIAGAIVLILVLLAIRSMIKSRRAGKSSCGCGSGCGGCHSACSIDESKESEKSSGIDELKKMETLKKDELFEKQDKK